MSNTEFNARADRFTSRSVLGNAQRPSLEDWLMKKGIAKNESGARAFTRGFIVFNFIVAALVFYFFILVSPPPMNGLTIIHNEAASVHQMIHQSGWPDAITYIRITTLIAVGDMLGALLALWFPILVVAAVIILFGLRHRHHR